MVAATDARRHLWREHLCLRPSPIHPFLASAFFLFYFYVYDTSAGFFFLTGDTSASCPCPASCMGDGDAWEAASRPISGPRDTREWFLKVIASEKEAGGGF